MPRPMDGRRSAVWTWLCRVGHHADYLLVLALAVYFWRFSQWRVTDDDEGMYLLAGQRVLNRELPYVGFSFPQLPGTAYLYGASQAVFGCSMSAGRILPCLLAALTQLLVFTITRNHAGRIAAACALLLFAANPLAPTWLTVAKTLAPGLFFALAASAVTLNARSHSGRAAGGALLWTRRSVPRGADVQR